jgi:hypothetical protein
MGEVLLAVLLVRAPALADADIHARVVPFFLANDIIRHCAYSCKDFGCSRLRNKAYSCDEARGIAPLSICYNYT